ncbi:MAG: hypothetical protein KMY50_00470 [Candidatus Desulforudis sp.]|nr:hypothetical protein [Desulforudis sp.]
MLQFSGAANVDTHGPGVTPNTKIGPIVIKDVKSVKIQRMASVIWLVFVIVTWLSITGGCSNDPKPQHSKQPDDPTALTDSEYTLWFITYTDEFGELMDRISAAAYAQDSSTLKAMVIQVPIYNQEAMNIRPSFKFTEVHSKYLEAMDLFDRGARMVYDGLENNNATRINMGAELTAQGNQTLSEVTKQVSKLNQQDLAKLR